VLLVCLPRFTLCRLDQEAAQLSSLRCASLSWRLTTPRRSVSTRT
jgi:hypothetical protein